MNHILRLSESVYTGLCLEVGTPTKVRIRREVMDTYYLSQRLKHKFNKFVNKWSGSKSEGFRLKTSDDDFMCWPLDHKVTCELSLISFYYQLIPHTTVILMECDDLPPGFTRLNLISLSSNTNIRSVCEAKNQKLYISSVLFRDGNLSLNRYDCSTIRTIPHGPCYTYLYKGGEIDFVWCFHSEEWPKNALPWIQRCRQHNWPSEIVISEILTKGFHVVPIGSTPENGEEWRISFSQAEQKLIYSMNHCQFLCYGLLKIFLTEVINFQNSTPVLCSYFMKTIVFWVMQTNNSLIWTPENLLYCFWASFKLLISWVRIGNCPNFFIPQNNMFRVKVIGSVQTSLFSQLYNLYCKGISCLLLSKTMRPYLSFAILNRTLILTICTLASECCIRCKRKLDFSLYLELRKLYFVISCTEEFYLNMLQIERLVRKNLTPFHAVTLQYITSLVLRATAIMIQNRVYPIKTHNKVYYSGNKASRLLKLSCTLGFVSDILYLAINFYRTCNYEQSLSCLKRAQERINVPYIMYRDHISAKDVYSRKIAMLSLNDKLKRAFVTDITISVEYIYIDELELERKICIKNGLLYLMIPPLVMLQMLLILNHSKLGDADRTQKLLQDLQTLILSDNGFYVPHELRDISWQILGICQQICGDYSGSLRSYQYSLQQKPCHMIKEATIFRMNTLPNGAFELFI